MRVSKVKQLIDSNSRSWNAELINNTFTKADAERILRIPLARSPHEDFRIWGGEKSGEFTVRSAYQLLQRSTDNPRAYTLQNLYRKFYRTLWSLNIPTKIKITIWRLSWNYLPTKVNLQHRKLVVNTRCPRCGEGAETMNHLFRDCAVTREVWKTLSFQNIMMYQSEDFVQWLTWALEQLNPNQSRLFCYALWAIWGDRNRNIHEGKVSNGIEVAKFVSNYIIELTGLEQRNSEIMKGNKRWTHPQWESIKINFDGAYNQIQNRSTSGVVARDSEGKVLLSCSEIHNEVPSAFATEAIACRKAVQVGVDHETLRRGEEFYMEMGVPDYAETQARHDELSEPD
ncbi:hypothetical protein Golax_025722 [Gossypium laxum]|uniref:Reverse transcriptase n=1 Tax=Gossypium laxum TaxID=34288 RepID=A0A7J9AZD6_9ROSI|nr:hypothetical protein [Gossypium laxum]